MAGYGRGLPTDGFTASGAGGHYASVFPSLGLVVVQNPGPYVQDDFGSAARGNPEFLQAIVGAAAAVTTVSIEGEALLRRR